MNYLAHTFLSYTDEQIVGNIIGDFIKNKNKEDYARRHTARHHTYTVQ